VRVETGAVAADDTVAGHWQGPGGRVPIYVGVGDHQCSVLGAGVIDAATVSINLGTGSQVAVVGPPPSHHFEHRPYFDGQDLTAVTHIPAGRALSEFVGFVRSVLELAGAGAADAWTMLADVTPDDVDGSTLHVDLAVFEGARGFDDGGRIGAILEGQLTPQNYLASVLRAFATQYIEVLELFDLEPAATIALGGGIARNLPHLATVLTRGSGRTVEAASELDESLIGLRALALRCGGRAPTVAQAWRLHGRACEVIDD
jgi:sugar (pentulose or hexulose) kinase